MLYSFLSTELLRDFTYLTAKPKSVALEHFILSEEWMVLLKTFID